jgi:hypothetical protein
MAEIICVSADSPEGNLAWALKLPSRRLSDTRRLGCPAPGRVGRCLEPSPPRDFPLGRNGRICYVGAGRLAIETDRTRAALTKLAGAK